MSTYDELSKLDTNSPTSRFTLTQVLQMIDTGDRFYKRGTQTGKAVWVEKCWCPHCGRYHSHSTPDATTDNNLDSLRYCNWKK